MKEQQQPHMKEVPIAKDPRGLKEQENSDISDDYKVYISEIQMEGNPTSFEEVLRSALLSKWQEAI
jgi:hypothetical protein